MNNTYLRGEIYLADLGEGVGSEQRGRRPVIIVQNDVGNKFSNTLIIAAISSSIKHKSHLPTHHIVNAGDGLTSNSVILLEQIRTIDKKRIISYIGHIDPKHIAAIEFSLAISLGFISPDDKSITVCLCDDCITKFANKKVFSVQKARTLKKTGICICCLEKSNHFYKITQKRR